MKLSRLQLAYMIFVLNGGPGSGNFGHAGRPGEVGGSAKGEHGPQGRWGGGGAGGSDEGKRSPFTQGPQVSRNPVLAKLEAKIRDETLTRDERKQASYDRSTVQSAMRTKYKDGSTVSDTLDKVIAGGATKIKISGPRAYLIDAQKNQWPLVTKLERDYADFVIRTMTT